MDLTVSVQLIFCVQSDAVLYITNTRLCMVIVTSSGRSLTIRSVPFHACTFRFCLIIKNTVFFLQCQFPSTS